MILDNLSLYLPISLATILVFAFIFYIKRNIANIKNYKKTLDKLKNENNILKSNLKFKNDILNAIPYPIWVREKNKKITYFNKKFNQFALTNLDLVNEDIEINDYEPSLAKQALATQTIQSQEIYTIIDNDRYLYKFYEVPMPSADSILGAAHDITEKNLIQKELENHISAQSDLLESTGTAIAIYGADTKLKFFNQAFIKLWGLEEKSLSTQPTYDNILEKLRNKRKLPEQIDFSNFKKKQLELFNTITSPYNDFFHLPNGKTLRILIIPYASGGLLFSYEDITDKLTLERSYKTLTLVQKETIDHLNEGITVFRENGKLEISNAKFAQMWNLESEYLESKPRINDILDKMYASVQYKGVTPTLPKDLFIQNINLRETKNIIIERDDNSVVEVLFVPLSNGATLISYHDITDSILAEKSLRERNEALKEADTLKTEFLANVSYELRSPLTSILGFSEILLNNYIGTLNKKQITYIKDIYTSSHYLMNLINNTLDLALIDAGYLRLELTKFDIHETIKPLEHLIQHRLKEKNLKLKFIFDKNIGDMIGDATRIKQVLFNLINNAIKHSKMHGEITLQILKDTNHNVIFTVQDHGKEIEKKYHKHIFDKLSKSPNHNPTPGPELGLSLVKTFIELHGGKVEFSSHLNRGNMFKCIVPTNENKLHTQDKVQKEISV